jgi:hypothetical protein
MLFLEAFAKCSKKPPRSRTISFSRLQESPVSDGGALPVRVVRITAADHPERSVNEVLRDFGM